MHLDYYYGVLGSERQSDKHRQNVSWNKQCGLLSLRIVRFGQTGRVRQLEQKVWIITLWIVRFGQSDSQTDKMVRQIKQTVPNTWHTNGVSY